MGSLRPYIDTIQKVSSKQNDEHPRRSIRTSAPVDTSICVGRYGRLRRSMRTSASVDADICVGRYGRLRRSTRMPNNKYKHQK